MAGVHHDGDLGVATLDIQKWNQMMVRFDWDERKSRANIMNHGIGLNEQEESSANHPRANIACMRSAMLTAFYSLFRQLQVSSYGLR